MKNKKNFNIVVVAVALVAFLMVFLIIRLGETSSVSGPGTTISPTPAATPTAPQRLPETNPVLSELMSFWIFFKIGKRQEA